MNPAQDRVIVKRLVGRRWMNQTATERRDLANDVKVYHYERNGYPVAACVSETGCREKGYSRIVCLKDGKKQTGQMLRARILFDFPPGQPFAVIDINGNNFSIHEFLLRERRKHYELVVTRVIKNKPLSMSAHGFELPGLEHYLSALQAAAERLGCSQCNHAHYAEI